MARKKRPCSKVTKRNPISFCYFKSDLLNGDFRIPMDDKVVTEYQWVDLKDMPNRLVDLFNLDLTKNKNSKILYSHASYLISTNIDQFTKEYFANIKTMDTLSGMEHTKTDNPYVFKVRFEPNMILAPVLTSTTTLSFPNDIERFHELKTINNSSFIIFTKSREFNKEVYQSDIITAITKEGKKVRIETLALGHITDTSFGFLDLKSKVKASEMLKAIKRQTPLGIQLFLKN
jgi:hypothetical protein